MAEGLKVSRISFLSLFCLAIFHCAQPVHAHRSPEGLTTIERNPNTGKIEIVHRLHLHDAEYALAEKHPDSNLILDSLKGKAQLALDVENAFQIVDSKTDDPIQLVLVGAQIEGDFILVFQELDGELPKRLKIRHDALRDSFPKQLNTVNFKLGPNIKTVILNGNPEWKTLVW